jgi:DNA-binding NarL/FixJ family response regulator
MKRVLVAVPDLFFGVPVTNVVRSAGAEPIPVRRPEDAFAALASESHHLPDAVIVDLAARIDPPDVIAAAAAQNIPVFAFGSHLDTAAIMAARAAGADKVVANSAMAAALPAWLAYQLAHPPAAEG